MIFLNEFLFCGNNSFEQNNVEFSLKKLPEVLPEIKFENKSNRSDHVLAFWWSHFLLCFDNEVYLCGFLNGKTVQVINLQLPDKSKIIQGCCSGDHCHLVTESGEYWLYNISSSEWKNVNQLLCAEKQNEKPCNESSVSKPAVYKVSCGDYMTIAVTDSGIYSVPLLLTFPQVKVLDVCCGKEHTVLLTEHNIVYSWGSGSKGQLGHGELETEEQPRELKALSGLNVVVIAAGGWHSCCVTEHGDLYSWGWNCCGQLGFPGDDHLVDKGETKDNRVVSVLAEPRPVDWPNEMSFVTQISCGSQHTIAVLGDNSVWGCGWNKYGQLLSANLPEKVFGMTRLAIPSDLEKDLIRVVCGYWNSALIT